MPTEAQSIACTTIANQLAHDHRRLDLLLADLLLCVDDGELDLAASLFEAFAREHRRHVSIEEKLLFPIFEARAWRAARMTAVMYREHRDMEEAIAQMRDALARRSVDRFREAHRQLNAVLPSHHGKEEQILYPAIDAVLSDNERAAVARGFDRRDERSQAAAP